MVVGVGPPATQNREPGQARKGAAAAVEACAGVWLALTAAHTGGGTIESVGHVAAVIDNRHRPGHASLRPIG